MSNPYNAMDTTDESKGSNRTLLGLANVVLWFGGLTMVATSVFMIWNRQSVSAAWETRRKDVDALYTRLNTKERELNESRNEQHEMIGRSKRNGSAALSVSRYNREILPAEFSFLLIRHEDGIGAVMFCPVTSVGNGARQPIAGTGRVDQVEYEWYFTRDLSATDFSGAEVLSGRGEIVDKYASEEERWANSSQLRVKFAIIDLGWRVGNWIEVPDSSQIEFAGTEASQISDVNPSDPSLLWIGRRSDTE